MDQFGSQYPWLVVFIVLVISGVLGYLLVYKFPWWRFWP